MKTAEKQPKRVPSDCFLAVFQVFRLFFRLFIGCFTVTHSALFSAVFRLFSMSGIWHLCRWPRRLQPCAPAREGERKKKKEVGKKQSSFLPRQKSGKIWPHQRRTKAQKLGLEGIFFFLLFFFTSFHLSFPISGRKP